MSAWCAVAGARPRCRDRLTSAVPRAQAVAAAVVLDNCVHIPCLYLPTFYCMREFSKPASSTLAPADVVRLGLGDYRSNLWDDVCLQACIFVPVQIANFGFNPPHLRVPTVVAAGAVWVTCLSYFRGGGRSSGPQAET